MYRFSFSILEGWNMADEPVQNALTALVPVNAEQAAKLRALLKESPIDPTSLDAVGTVHFARIFVMEENNPAGISSNILAVITSYDGDFGIYIQAFVNQESVAKFFDDILKVVDVPGAEDLIPVRKNAAAFADFVKKYDVTNPDKVWGQWYSAYPTRTVQSILNSG